MMAVHGRRILLCSIATRKIPPGNCPSQQDHSLLGMTSAFQAHRILFVRCESLGDKAARRRHVCFTPESGHSSRRSECPLCAKSGHFRGRSLSVQMQPQTALHAVPATAMSLGTTMVDQSVVPNFLGAFLLRHDFA